MKALQTIFSLMFIFVLSNIITLTCNASNFEPYISYIDSTHLDTIRVVVDPSAEDANNTRYETNFGDSFVSSLIDVSHKYQSPGTYKISVTEFHKNKVKNYFEKTIYVNLDLKINDVAGSVVFNQNNLVNNKNYSFNINNTQASKLYKLTLSRSSTQSLIQSATYTVMNLIGNVFLDGYVMLNGIKIADLNELSSATNVQKIVILSNTNKLLINVKSNTLAFTFNIQVSEVLAVKDTTPPVLNFDITSNS